MSRYHARPLSKQADGYDRYAIMRDLEVLVHLVLIPIEGCRSLAVAGDYWNIPAAYLVPTIKFLRRELSKILVPLIAYPPDSTAARWLELLGFQYIQGTECMGIPALGEGA